MTVIDMQTMRYINLLNRVSNVKTRRCFVYNNSIIFAVPHALIRRAIGNNGQNIRDLQTVIGKKVRIIREAEEPRDIERFIRDVVDPAGFKSIEIKDGEIIVSSGNRTRAATLIGRNKVRFLELSKIIEDVFGKTLKIV